jgi:small subunit ribosomal protein S3
MAQKASPYAIRLGYNQDWNSYFFFGSPGKRFDWIKKDKLIRDYFSALFPDTTRLKIEYTKNAIFIYLYIPNINLVLGEKNQKLDRILQEVYDLINDREIAVKINLIEVKRPYTHAQAICNLVVGQLKDRIRSRQIIRDIGRKLLDEREVKGWAIRINGLIDGSEIGQRKKTTHARMPLSEIDSNIDLGEKEAFMVRGVIGVKVLIYKGKI